MQVGRRAWLGGILGWGLVRPARAAAFSFALGPGVAGIGFTAYRLHLFPAEGRFTRFVGNLTIDPAHPEDVSIAVAIEAASLEMAWDVETRLLRSADWFDVARYPLVRFASTAVVAAEEGDLRVTGLLRIRETTRQVTLVAHLVREGATAGVTMHGRISRAAFGMTADPVMAGDEVALRIVARLALP